MRKAIALLLVLVMAFSLSGCCLKHEWKDATCTEPKTCAKCGKTEGEPLGHTWEDATCTEPKTCSTCGATEGEPNGHENTRWIEEDTDIVRAKRSMVLYCDDCETEVDTKTEDIDSFIDGDEYLFTAKEFVERLQLCYNEMDDGGLPLTFEYAINSYGNVNFDIYNKNHSWLAWGIFYDVDGKPFKEANENGRINCIALFFPTIEGLDLDTTYYLFEKVGSAACVAADPSITDISVYSEPIFMNEYAEGEGSQLHGLTFTCMLKNNNEFQLNIEIP